MISSNISIDSDFSLLILNLRIKKVSFIEAELALKELIYVYGRTSCNNILKNIHKLAYTISEAYPKEAGI